MPASRLSGEIQILYNLDMGRVHYPPQTLYLNFCNSFVVEIRGTIESVMSALGSSVKLRASISTLSTSSPQRADTAYPEGTDNCLLALRIQGIQVSTGGTLNDS